MASAVAQATRGAGTAAANVTAQVPAGTAAAATSSAGGKAPRFEQAACPFPLGPGEEDGKNVQCGYLIVPEEHANPKGKTLRLAVATLKATGGQPAAEPIVYLNGGPGQGAESTLAAFPQLPIGQALLRNYTMIFFDQRGTGDSQPALNCPNAENLVSAAGGTQQVNDKVIATLAQCHDQLTSQGINLNAYNSVENAADVNDLRTALGYDKINLLGISYGTRLALTVMRDFPQIVRSTVIGLIDPPQENLLAGRPIGFDASLKRVFTGCAADPDCNAKYPNLPQVFAEDVATLNATPAKLPLKDPTTGKETEVPVNGTVFLTAVYTSLFLGPLIPTVPILLTQVHAGKYDALTPALIVAAAEAQSISLGMNYAVQCQEAYSFTNLDEVKAQAQETLPEIRDYELTSIGNDLAVCQKWNVKKADAREHQPIQNDLPTLLLSGQYDPITPPNYSTDAAKTLPKSVTVEFPGVGHDPIETSGACGAGIIVGFLQNPAAKPDTACSASLAPKLGTPPKQGGAGG